MIDPICEKHSRLRCMIAIDTKGTWEKTGLDNDDRDAIRWALAIIDSLTAERDELRRELMDERRESIRKQRVIGESVALLQSAHREASHHG